MATDKRSHALTRDDAGQAEAGGRASHETRKGGGFGFTSSNLFRDALTHELSGPGVDDGRKSQQSDSATEDATELRMGAVPDYNPNTPTFDGEVHQHFELVGYPFHYGDILNLNVGDWADPAGTGFDGYAQDGTRYTAGVQDVGPIRAPWSSEAVSSSRSSKQAAPNQVLCVLAGPVDGAAGPHELVLFDLDEWLSSGNLDVWMRFKPPNAYSISGDATTGRVIQKVGFHNGVFYFAMRKGSAGGVVNVCDFKSDTQDVLQLFVTTEHWVAGAGKTVVNRNDSAGMAITTSVGGRPEMRLPGDDPHTLAVYGEGDEAWLVVVTQSGFGFYTLDKSGTSTQFARYQLVTGPTTADRRAAMFDRYGMLWVADENVVWLNGYDYQGGVFVDPRNELVPAHVRERYRVVYLPSGVGVSSMAEARDAIFCATQEGGVYRIDKTDLSVHLAYTVAGDGGGGQGDAAPAGEVVAGDKAIINQLQGVDTAQSSYLAISTRPGGGTAAFLRLHDDQLMVEKVWPDLKEDGAYFARALMKA